MTLIRTTVGVCKLVLVRHEHTELAGTFCGHLNPPLSRQGRSRLKQLADALSRHALTAVYSSDLRRTRETAQAISAPHDLPILSCPDLRELAFGEWEGLAWRQVVSRDPAFAQRWLDEYPSLATPGGEECDHFLARVQRAISEIVEESQEGCSAVVTHAGVIRTILAGVTLECTEPIDLSPCPHGSWWEIWRENGRWTLRAFSARSDRPEREVTEAKVGRTA
jgi:alpha-ribazole phosphatase